MEYSLALVQWLSAVVLLAGGLALLTYLRGKIPQYGKHATEAKFTLDARLAWIVQECPSFFIPAYIIADVGPRNISPPNLIIILLFAAHYFQRSFVYTLLMSKHSRPMPLYLAISGFVFTSANGFAIASHQAKHGDLGEEWLHSPQFVVGILMWTIGVAINLHSDHVLRTLRRGNEGGYKIPQGGMFNYVSGANYFGEIVEWCGLAVASNFALPTTCFAVSTALVIGTRGLAHHKFYLQKFEDYPANRKAVLPFLL